MKKSFKYLQMVALFLSVTIFLGCGKDDEKEGGSSSINTNANIVGLDNTVLNLEIPNIPNKQYDYICHKLSNGDVNYTILYDKTEYHSVWVAYTYNTNNAKKNAPTRTNAWSPEVFYENDKEHQLDIQTFPGYNRGHLVGSAERYYSTEANEQTFYMSNMSPQQSAFNSDYWGEIEDKARDVWGRGVIDTKSSFYGGTLYIVKGGSLLPTTANPNPIMSHVNVKNTLGKQVQMAVPRYYFMACLFVSSTGGCKAIGFWMEHKDYKLNTEDAKAMQELRRNACCSIDELEYRTGIDFFCNLADATEDPVESTYDVNQWSGL